MAGIFSTLNIASRGLNAQQTALDVTSHNIANANTDGYSRQVANMETTSPLAMPSLTNSTGSGQLGTGVQVSSITRIRDSYLDYQVRAQNATKGSSDAQEEFLSQVQGVFNELGDTGISTSVDNVYDSWQALSDSPEVSSTRTVVAQQSKALTDQLNSTYSQLVTLKGNSQDVIQQDVVNVNSMLDQVNQLNQQIITVTASGSQPNDLMDKRDLLLDQLSVKFGITVDKKASSGDDLSPTDTGDMKNASLVTTNSNASVDRFSYVTSIVPSAASPEVVAGEAGSYDITYYKNGDTTTNANKVEMTMTLTSDQYKSLNQGGVLWADSSGYAIDANGNRLAGTEFLGTDTTGTPVQAIDGTAGNATGSGVEAFQPQTGELNGYTSVQTDIGVYIDQLNSLAKGIAFSVNAVESGESDASLDTEKFFVNSDNPTNEAGITAGNISVNQDIIDDVTKIKVGAGDTPEATDGSRALAISDLRNVKLDMESIGDTTSRSEFLGSSLNLDTTSGVSTITSSTTGTTIGGYFSNTINALAVQTQEATRNVTNNDALLSSLTDSRTSISGVSLDEEMANMVQFQHAYAANAKVISTVDELLDIIINDLKK